MAALVTGHETIYTVGLGVFLVAAGIAGLRRRQSNVGSVSSRVPASLAGQFGSSFLGVLLNPITFVTMTAVLAIFGGIQANLGTHNLASMAGAAFVGGMLVWLFITHGIALMRLRLGQRGGARLHKALNYCILLLGVAYMIRPFLPHAMG